MSRRIEITVPNEWVDPVRRIIEDADKCNLSEHSEKPGMVVEVPGSTKTIFLITVPGPAVSSMLETFRKNGIGTSVGRIILTSLDYMKPDLTKPLAKVDLTEDNMKVSEKDVKEKKVNPLKGLQHFMKARKTTEEMYNEISNNTNMTINTWLNLIGASIMAAGGLTTNVNVFIVAAMLVSPIMGPILGMTMGYRVADFDLFKRGFVNEMKMALTTFLCGCLFGMALGNVGKTYKWPNDAMMPEGQAFNLIISIIVSAAAGMVLGVSLTSTGGNALVGTAISAGLLPPLVNAGMMYSFAATYAPYSERQSYFDTGTYNILFYFTHVVTIVIVANFVFWLKDIDPRFKEGEDCDFNDLPAFVEHKKQLEENGKKFTEKEKAELFWQNVGLELKSKAVEMKDKATHFLDRVGIHAEYGPVDGQEEGDYDEDEDEEAGTEKKRGRRETVNPLHASSRTEPRNSLSIKDKASISGSLQSERQLSSAQSLETIREQVRSFYATNNPSKLGEVDSILERYAGRETELLAKLQKQYGIREQIRSFYASYNPAKQDEVDSILERYAGRENELLAKLHKQYNVPFEGSPVPSSKTSTRL